MKRKISAITLFLLLLIGVIYGNVYALQGPISSEENKITSNILFTEGVATRVNSESDYGVGIKKVYKDYYDYSGIHVNSPYVIWPWDRQYRWPKYTVDQNIIIERLNDEIDDFGEKVKGEIYREYKIKVFPNGGIRYYGNEEQAVDEKNVNVGVVFTKDIQPVDVSVKVEFPDGRTNKRYGKFDLSSHLLSGDLNYDSATPGCIGIAYAKYVRPTVEEMDNYVFKDISRSYLPLRLGMLPPDSSANPTNPQYGWFSGNIWDIGDYPRNDPERKASNEGTPIFKREDFNGAFVFQTGVDIYDHDYHKAKYEIKLRVKVTGDSISNDSFSGIIAAASSYQQAQLFTAANIDGFKIDMKKAETVKINYKEHFNGINGQNIPKRIVGVTKSAVNSIEGDRESSGKLSLDATNSTKFKSFTENSFAVTQLISNERSVALTIDDYKRILNFNPSDIDGYTIRNTNGSKYSISGREVNGVKVFDVDVYYDADIIPANSVSSKPDGYSVVDFRANPSTTVTIHSYAPGEITRYYVRTAANKRIGDLQKPDLSQKDKLMFDKYVYTSTTYAGRTATDNDLISSDLILSANYLPEITDQKPLDVNLSKYNTVTFNSGQYSSFAQGGNANSTKVVYVLRSPLVGNKLFRDIQSYVPTVYPISGYTKQAQLWKYDNNNIVLDTDIMNNGNKVINAQLEREFDKDNIAKIEIVKLKQDYWPNQYFAPENSVNPLTVRLTDTRGKIKEIRYIDTVTENSSRTPAFDYYNLGLYIPDAMTEHLRYEDVSVGQTTVRKIVVPMYIQKHMNIGVQWNTNPNIKAESDINGFYHNHNGGTGTIGIFTTFSGLSGFEIKIYRNDDLQKQDVTEVPVNTPINIVVTVPSELNNVSNYIYVDVPGVDGKVELKKTTIDGKVVYSNVETVGSSKMVPIVPVNPTLDNKLNQLAGVNNNVTAFEKTHRLDVIPLVIDRNGNSDAEVKGDDYVRIVFDSATGNFGGITGAKKVYDVYKTKTWAEFIREYPIVNPTAPTETPIFVGWVPNLPSDTTVVSTLGKDVTIGNKSIKVATFTAQYDVKIKEATGDNAPVGYVRLNFNAGDGSYTDISGKTKSIDVYSSLLWNDSDLVNYVAAITAKLSSPNLKSFDKWNPLVPNNSEKVKAKDFTALYKNDIVEGGNGVQKPDGYVTVTFEPTQKGRLVGVGIYYVNPTKNIMLGMLNKPSIVEVDGWKFKGWDLVDTTVIAKDETVTATYTSLDEVTTTDPGDKAEQYYKVTFAPGDHGRFNDDAKTTVWVLKTANKTVADALAVTNITVTDAEGYKFSGWNPTAETVIAKDETVTATYIPLNSLQYTPIPKDVSTDKGVLPNPSDLIVNKDSDEVGGDVTKLPKGTEFTYVDENGNPVTPDVSQSGTDVVVIVKVKYPDGSTTTVNANIHVNTDAESYKNNNPNAKGTGTVYIGETVTVDKIVINPEPNGELTTVIPINTDTAGKKSTTGIITFEDGSTLEIPIEVDVIDRDSSKIPEIIGTSNGDILTTDNSFIVVVPKTDGKKTDGNLVVKIDDKEVPAVDNGDGTYTVNVPDNVTLTPNTVISATFTEDEKKSSTTTKTVKLADSDKYTPNGENIIVDNGGTPIVTDGISNKNDLPPETTYEFDGEIPDTTIPGNYPINIKVTYPDGSSELVGINIIVKNKVVKIIGNDSNTEDKPVNNDKPVNKDNAGIEKEDSNDKPIEKTGKPTIDEVKQGDTEITGSAEPFSKVVIRLNDGTEITTVADKDGKFRIRLSKPIAGTGSIVAIAKADGKAESDEATVEIKILQENNIPINKTVENTNSWSLLDLLFTIGAVLATIYIFIAKNDKLQKDKYGARIIYQLLLTVLSIVSIVILVITQDFNAHMILFDSYTLIFTILFIISIVGTYLGVQKDSDK